MLSAMDTDGDGYMYDATGFNDKEHLPLLILPIGRALGSDLISKSYKVHVPNRPKPSIRHIGHYWTIEDVPIRFKGDIVRNIEIVAKPMTLDAGVIEGLDHMTLVEFDVAQTANSSIRKSRASDMLKVHVVIPEEFVVYDADAFQEAPDAT